MKKVVSKTKRVLLATLIVISVLSFSVVVPTMAENTTATDEKAIDGEYLKSGVCDVSIDVDSAYSKYGQYSTITFSGWIKNQEWNYVDYDMTLTLQGPGGDSWDFDGRVYYYKRIEHTVHKNPPSGGWIPGTYTICNDVKATGTNCVYHDCSCRSFKVVPSPKPDLVITDIWGDNSTIYYTIKNQGDMAAGASNTSLTIDGVFKASDYVSSLESGERRTESFDYTWTCTDKSKIKVCADYKDVVEESNEKNNCRTETWLRKDLVITNVWTDNNTIYYKIKNAGYEKVGASNTSLTIDGVFITSHHVGPLEPEEERTESFIYTWTCTGGNDIIEVCADYMDAMVEGDEENNCRDKTWTCPPDISVSPASFDVRLPPDVVKSYTLTIGNIGGGELEFSMGGTASQPRWPKTTSGGVASSSPALGDIDGDGDIEIVVGSCDDKVYAWHHNGSLVAGWPKETGDTVISSPALGDIDGDGDIEIVVGSCDDEVYAWHHDGSTVTGWPKTTDGSVWSSPALCDIDGDGSIEVVVGCCEVYPRVPQMYAWHHDGSTVTGWPQKTSYSVYSSPVLGDIDGDGDIEIVVGSGYSWDRDGAMYAWHHDGSAVAGWPKKTDKGVASSPALGDIDGDGDIEVVVGSGYHTVHVWDCSGIYNPNNIEWEMFHHDVRHTGLYEAKPPRKAGWLSEYTTNGILYSGSQKNITVTFNTSGLEFGNYHVNITITSNDPDENPVIIPVQLTVTTSQKGDLNGDDNITSTDAAIALQLAAIGGWCADADVSGDDRVTSLDALMILQAAAGAINL